MVTLIESIMNNYTVTDYYQSPIKYANVGLLHIGTKDLCIDLSSRLIKNFDIFTDRWN